jgi:hypothetical protein
MSDSSQVVVEIAAPPAELRSCWEQVPEIERFDIAPVDGDYYRCSLTAAAACDLRPMVFLEVRSRGWIMRELSRTRHSLEDIFVHVTRPDREEES